MKWTLSISLVGLMAALPAYADGEQDGASSADSANDAYELRQVRRAETDAEACRQSHAHARTKEFKNPRLAELSTRRMCALFDELAREKRTAYEQRKRIAKQQRQW